MARTPLVKKIIGKASAANKAARKKIARKIEMPEEPKREPFLIKLSIDLNPKLRPETAKTIEDFGKCEDGRHFTREIIVPGEITLYGLHYVIQQSFGFKDSHLWYFALPDARLQELADNKLKNIFRFLGVFLHVPDDGPDFRRYIAAEEYDEKKHPELVDHPRYGGPYTKRIAVESAESQDEYAAALLKSAGLTRTSDGFKNMSIREFERRTSVSLNELMLNIPLAALIVPPTETLLTAAEWNRRFKAKAAPAAVPDDFPPITKRIDYMYDFRDRWEISVTRKVLPSKYSELAARVGATERPVCITKDGRMLTDDIGGIPGYIDLLQSTFGKWMPKISAFESQSEVDSAAHRCFGPELADISASDIF